MNHAFQLGEIPSCLVNLNTVLLCRVASGNQLFVKRIRPVYQGFSLFVKDVNSGVLSETLLLPFAQRTVILVNCSLLPLSQLLVFAYLMLLIFVFSFNSLIFHDDCLNFLIQLSDFGFLVFNFDSNGSNLFGNLLSFIGSFVVLCPHNIEFSSKGFLNVFLALNLRFEIALE